MNILLLSTCHNIVIKDNQVLLSSIKTSLPILLTRKFSLKFRTSATGFDVLLKV